MNKVVPIQPGPTRRRLGKLQVSTVTLAHGGGGKAMRDLIDDVFISAFDNPALAPLEDQARFSRANLAMLGDRLAFTTDSYVVDPLYFPGRDIGKLAVCRTINDLAVGGAKPLYLSCGAIIEEGMAVDDLRAIACYRRLCNDAGGACDRRPVARGLGRLMHELAINQSIVTSVTEHCGGKQVSRVVLEVGTLSGVMTDPVLFCFDLAAEGTPLEGRPSKYWRSRRAQDAARAAVSLSWSRWFAPAPSSACRVAGPNPNVASFKEAGLDADAIVDSVLKALRMKSVGIVEEVRA